MAAGVFLILLIIFVAQNLNDAPIHFLGLNGQVSIGLALLLAGVCGLIIAAVPASARIWQLGKALKKTRVAIFRRRPDSDQPRTTLPIDRTSARECHLRGQNDVARPR